MRVMIIQPWIRVGGAEWVSVQLARDLRQRGHEARLVALFSETDGMPREVPESELILAPGKLRRLFSASRFFFLLFGPWMLLYLVLRHSRGVDVLNPHNFPACWVAVIAGALRRQPVVWTCNEPPARVPLKDVLHLPLADSIGWLAASSFLDRFFVRRVRVIHVLSQKTWCEVLERYGRKSKIIRSGVDYDFYRAGSAAEACAKHDLDGKYVVLAVGKLHPQKNPGLCLEVVRLLRPSEPGILLLYVGAGPMKAKLATMAEQMGLGKHVRFLGLLSATELRNLYAACDLVLFPAINQSWGLIPFEALCAKRLSIVSSDSGAAEIISWLSEDLVANPNAQAFAASMKKLRQDRSAYERIATRGADLAALRLNHRFFAESMLGLLCQVVEGHSLTRQTESKVVRFGGVQ